LIDALARNLRDSLPNPSFIGFTGMPIEKTDANTRAVFGDYISIYDIQRYSPPKTSTLIPNPPARLWPTRRRSWKCRRTNSDCRTALTSEFELQHLKFVWAALNAPIESDVIAHFDSVFQCTSISSPVHFT